MRASAGETTNNIVSCLLSRLPPPRIELRRTSGFSLVNVWVECVRRQMKRKIILIISFFSRASLITIAVAELFLLLSDLLYIMMFGRETCTHISLLSMARFTSLLRASLFVIFITSLVYNSDAATQYVDGTSIFGRCANFSIQAGTSVAFNGVQTIITSGNVGVAPGMSITGTPQLGNGYTQEAGTTPAINCAADEATAYSILKGATCTNMLATSELSGVTLFPGVYCTGAGTFTLTAANLYLDAQGESDAQFIFQAATTLTTSTNTNIILLNGARAENIYWQVGSSATLGSDSSFNGQILAYASISVGTNVNVVGRLYAQAAVSFAGADNIKLRDLEAGGGD